jgi:hypothetical protein
MEDSGQCYAPAAVPSVDSLIQCFCGHAYGLKVSQGKLGCSALPGLEPLSCKPISIYVTEVSRIGGERENAGGRGK